MVKGETGILQATENPDKAAAQEEAKPSAILPEVAAGGDLQPYKLVVSSQTGKASSSQLSPEDAQWFFAIDWGADAAAQYDPGRIEHPLLHDSVQQAKVKVAAGPKPYDLDECIEVVLSHAPYSFGLHLPCQSRVAHWCRTQPSCDTLHIA